MPTLVELVPTAHTPESLVAALQFPASHGLVLLRSACFEIPEARYSFVASHPFLTLRTHGSRCEISGTSHPATVHFGNPWRLLEALLARYELLDDLDLPFPLGGAFGFWGYGLRRFVEPRLATGPVDDLELPDAVVHFHDSLVVFDHRTSQTWVVSTGIRPDGSRDEASARRTADRWKARLATPTEACLEARTPSPRRASPPSIPRSSMNRDTFVAAIEKARAYIRQGHIVIRVEPGGASFRVIILDDAAETFTVKAVFGPYQSR